MQFLNHISRLKYLNITAVFFLVLAPVWVVRSHHSSPCVTCYGWGWAMNQTHWCKWLRGAPSATEVWRRSWCFGTMLVSILTVSASVYYFPARLLTVPVQDLICLI